MKRILSIDGGGIRGLIPAVICQYIEKSSGKRIHDLFHLIAGTSTGGIITMGLTLPGGGKPAADLVDFYRYDGVKIFSQPRGALRYLTRPKFDNSQLKRIIESIFKTAKISEALIDILITTYDIKYRTPLTISRRAARANATDDYLMREVALATSAAPTYFSPLTLGDRVLVDGGIVANNPACLALAEARQLWPNDEFILVSLGTGTLAKAIQHEKAAQWGLIRWASPLIDCIFDGTAKATEDFLFRTTDRELYWRFQYGLNETTETLDGVSKDAITGLIEIGESIIRENQGRFDGLLELLVQEKSDERQETESDHTRELLERIRRGVQKSLSIKSRMFVLGVHNKLTELSGDVADWEQGQIRVPADDRGRFLVGLYAEAKKNVFSTRLKRFSGTFRCSSLTDDILHANRIAGVPTTRIFVFESGDDCSGFDYREMARQREAGIDVRVLTPYLTPIDAIEDFTIIDETAVGITKFEGPRDAAARWKFDDRVAIRKYILIRDQLMTESVSFTDFTYDQRPRSTLWGEHALVDVSPTNIGSYQQLSKKFFGDDAASDTRVLSIQQQAGAGVYLLQRHAESDLRTVGILSLVPVSLQGFRRLEADSVKGAELTAADVVNSVEANALAYYLGSIAGVDRNAKAALVDALTSAIRELTRDGVESIFARPVTDDGLRLLKEMHWEGPLGHNEPLMNHVCRLRL